MTGFRGGNWCVGFQRKSPGQVKAGRCAPWGPAVDFRLICLAMSGYPHSENRGPGDDARSQLLTCHKILLEGTDLGPKQGFVKEEELGFLISESRTTHYKPRPGASKGKVDVRPPVSGRSHLPQARRYFDHISHSSSIFSARKVSYPVSNLIFNLGSARTPPYRISSSFSSLEDRP